MSSCKIPVPSATAVGTNSPFITLKRASIFSRYFSNSECRSLASLELSCNGLKLIEPKQPPQQLSFDLIQDVTMNTGLLYSSLHLRLHNGAIYTMVSFKKRAVKRAHEIINDSARVTALRNKWTSIEVGYAALKSLLSQCHYISNREYLMWEKAHPLSTIPDMEALPTYLFTDRELYILKTVRQSRRVVNERNQKFANREVLKWIDFFDTVESNPLTLQQKLAVVCDEDNTRVLAGAGTGKTSTIIAKVGYLLKAELADPGEILLLSFTRKSAEEMRDRIAQKLSVNIMVRTFHSLGLEILAEVEDRKPSLSKDAGDPQALREYLLEILQSLVLKDTKLHVAYQSFLTSNLIPYRSSFEFKTKGEHMAYLKASGMRALSGNQLKSYEEIEIANWLFLNGIRFDYEGAYEVNTATREYRQYAPDFYYPDYRIYHEHFGINRDGSTAPFINQAKYHEGMQWKRELHENHGTALIETYSWMKSEGTLLSSLEKQLINRGVELKPLSPEEVLKRFRDANLVNPFIDLLSSFLALYKGSCLEEEDVWEKSHQTGDYHRNQTFLKLFLPLLHAYEEKHYQANEIDFDDMIRQALRYVAAGRYKSKFSYILVDEFQDVSQGRARLLGALRDQVSGAKLFCVGDDWQSIYRFAGSDLSLVSGFELFFGFTKTVALDKTFRFNNKIVDFSSTFILKNPSQLPKELTPHVHVNAPAVELIMVAPNESPFYALLERVEAESPGGASVFILGRYGFSVPVETDRKYYKAKFPLLKIEFMTIHKSKGLEAEYVVVCGLQGGKHGFPSEIADDPILNMVLAKPDDFTHGEERRLFYVAITRARKKVYLVGDRTNPSCFVEEIQQDPAYNAVKFQPSTALEAYCPQCTTGLLIPKDGVNGKFALCSNFPLCNHAQGLCSQCHKGIYARAEGSSSSLVCTICGDEAEACPKCGCGTLLEKVGQYGRFLGCTMYRSELQCRYTRRL